MKQLLISSIRAKYQGRKSEAQMKRMLNSFLFLFYILLFITGCKKQDMNSTNEVQTTTEKHVQDAGTLQSRMGEGDVAKMYKNLSPRTLWELQQVRSAIAQYRNIENAIKDGYADIAVDIEHMGHHYMKASLVDDVFDVRHPEILVYNRNEQGEQVLMAAEFAVPLTFPMPEGFAGSEDVWDGATGFPFWLVHTWVWQYNPDGAFKPLNPLVELH